MRKRVRCPLEDIAPVPLFAPPMRSSCAREDAHGVDCTHAAGIERPSTTTCSLCFAMGTLICVAQHYFLSLNMFRLSRTVWRRSFIFHMPCIVLIKAARNTC